MRKIRKIVLFLLLMGIFPNFAFALKVGSVDIQKVLLEINEGKRVRKQLKNMFEKRQKRVKKEEESIRKMQKDFENQRAVMNDKAKLNKEKKIQERVVKLQQSMMKHQQDIREEENKKKRPIIERIKNIVDGVSKKKKYDFVFEATVAPIYIKSGFDLTGEIIKAYNKKYK